MIKDIKEKTGARVSYGKINNIYSLKISTDYINCMFIKSGDEFNIKKINVSQKVKDEIGAKIGRDGVLKNTNPRNKKYSIIDTQCSNIKNLLIAETKKLMNYEEIIKFIKKSKKIVGENIG